MTEPGKTDFKKRLKQIAQGIIEQRIQVARIAIENAQHSANSEEKRSAGDKYETSRAMSHLEKDMQARQLAENLKELSILQAVDTGIVFNEVSNGSFVTCESASFFIAAGLGKQVIDGKVILFLSPHAPAAKLMLHKKIGDGFVFNGLHMQITDLY
jgi:transcription elongation GreA/GreB family factor